MRMMIGSRRGSSMLEFTLVGIPLIFVLISIFEISRGMWIYHTLAYAAKDAARYAAVHGQWCSQSAGCPITVAGLATYLSNAGIGLLPDKVQVTFSTATRTVPCSPLQTCLTNANCFPAAADCTSFNLDAVPGMPVTVTAVYPFESALSMFWPGGGPGIVFGTFNLPAEATERILF